MSYLYAKVFNTSTMNWMRKEPLERCLYETVSTERSHEFIFELFVFYDAYDFCALNWLIYQEYKTEVR